MKMLAETTGSFMLQDLGGGQTLEAHRPSVVFLSPFLAARIALSQVTKISDVPDEATDADFAKFWEDSDGDQDLAVSAFLSQFSSDETKPAARRRKN